MRAQLAHSVMAAGLADPALLAAWRRDPTLLRRHGVEPNELDLDALWGFAGLAMKVRHNPLRTGLPFTFRLLEVAGLELQVFASYATFRAARGTLGKSLQAKIEGLIEFLGGWLEPACIPHLLLWDLIRHEAAQLELVTRAPNASVPDVSDAGCEPTPKSVPRLRGTLLLREFQSDPQRCIAQLRERSPQLTLPPEGPHYWGYWLRAGGEATVLELDAAGFHLLSRVDGRRTVRDLQRTIEARGQQRRLLRALGDLAQAGLLHFTDATAVAR